MEEEMIYMRDVPRVSVRTRTQDEYTVRMSRVISGADDFAEEFAALQAARAEDVVRLDIVSGGGSLDTCIMIRRAMAQCDANIIGWIGPTCASAATAIALQCDGWEVDDTSSFMIHTGSFAPGFGKARDVEAATRHNVQQIENFVRVVYTGFLTEEEILKVLDGKELYFSGEELAVRLQSYADYRDRVGEVEEEPINLSQKSIDEFEARE